VDEEAKRFVFVCGCARSGTGALAQLLASSDSVVIGMERFGHLVRPGRFTLAPDCFEKDRFFNVRPGDTFYDDFDAFHRFDRRMREKFETARYVGDKRPEFYEVYPELRAAFPGAKILFIYRNPVHVASSFHGRIKRGDNWPRGKDYRQAVVEWNRSVELTLQAADAGSDIACVEYERAFREGAKLNGILEFLGLPVDEGYSTGVRRVLRRAAHLTSERELLLTPQEVAYVCDRANLTLRDDLERITIAT